VINQRGDLIIEAVEICDIEEMLRYAKLLGNVIVIRSGSPPAVQVCDSLTIGNLEQALERAGAEIEQIRLQVEIQGEMDAENSGMLADLADILFGDEERALNYGYDGIIERAELAARALRKHT